MSSASPCHVLVAHQYATDGHLPVAGEIVVVRLAQDLFGPGSVIESSLNLPSDITRRNYHKGVVLSISLDSDFVSFTILPMPAYSFTDPDSGLSSTSWLLDQPDDFQRLHIPVPYEEALTQLHPPFPTPARFGGPLQIGEWKNSRPSWVQTVPQVATLKYTTTFKCFEPPMKLSKEEIGRLKKYYLLPSTDDTIMGSGSLPHQSNGSNNHREVGLSTTRSSALQALYANDAVKRAFAVVDRPSVILYSGSDDDDEDDDEDWEDNMDPITFLRYYAAGHPVMEKIVQERDRKMRERLEQGIANWAEGVQSEAF